MKKPKLNQLTFVLGNRFLPMDLELLESFSYKVAGFWTESMLEIQSQPIDKAVCWLFTEMRYRFL